MKSLLLCAFLVTLPGILDARPKTVDHERLIRDYARLHPNTGPDEPECEVVDEDDSQIGPLNAIVDRSRLWTDNTVYYDIIEPEYGETEKSLIRDAIADLQKSTAVNGVNCINFKETSNATNVIYIVACGRRCSSSVGMVGGAQRMCLSERCLAVHGTMMHEFLHALGFHHEHKRADRDNYVYINFNNIRPGAERNYNKLIEGVTVDHLKTTYDYGSIMHYSAYGFAVDRSIPTIVTLDPNAIIGQRLALSKVDRERVQILYGCIKPSESTYFKHLEDELY